jgi:hypothetical protein
MNSSLLSAYNRFTSPNDRTPGMVDVGEAQELIEIAREANFQRSGCCGGRSLKGDNGLRELVALHGDHFEPESYKTVQNYLQSHGHSVRPPAHHNRHHGGHRS